MYLPQKSVSDPINNDHSTASSLGRRHLSSSSLQQQSQSQSQPQPQPQPDASRLRRLFSADFVLSSDLVNGYDNNNNNHHHHHSAPYRSISLYGGQKDASSTSASPSAFYRRQSHPISSSCGFDNNFGRGFAVGRGTLFPNTNTNTNTNTTTKSCYCRDGDDEMTDIRQNKKNWTKLDTTIPLTIIEKKGNIMPLRDSMICDDDSEKASVATTSVTSAAATTTTSIKNDKENKYQTILSEYQRFLSKWKGPLSPFGHYWINTEISLFVVKHRMEEILSSMVDNKLVDYSIDENNQCVHGRAFGRYESCTFVVALFNFQSYNDNSMDSDNDNDNDNDNHNDDDSEITTPNDTDSVKPMIEIRRMSGDGFVFENFFSAFTKQMSQKQIILPDRCNSNGIFNCGANADVNEDMRDTNSQLMDLNWSMDLDLSLTNFDTDLSDLGSLTMEPCQNLTVGDNYEDSDDAESSKTFKDREDEIREWFTSIIDRNSYGDYVRLCTVQLLEAFENCQRDGQENDNDNNDEDENAELIIVYLDNISKASQQYIADELLALITSDFYDVFCIRNIVKIVHHILKAAMPQHHRMYQNLKQVKKQIQQVKDQWSGKCSFRVSPNFAIEFERSQQIVQCCNACLEAILALSL